MRKSTSTLLLTLIALASSAVASDDKSDRASLRGLKSVCIVVEITATPQDGASLTKQSLQAEIQARLDSAGITVDKDATACVYLNLRPLSAIGKNGKPIGLYALEMSLQFLQMVALARDPSLKTYSPTWSVANMATVPLGDLRNTASQIADDLTDRFVEAYRSVNPK